MRARIISIAHSIQRNEREQVKIRNNGKGGNFHHCHPKTNSVIPPQCTYSAHVLTALSLSPADREDLSNT